MNSNCVFPCFPSQFLLLAPTAGREPGAFPARVSYNVTVVVLTASVPVMPAASEMAGQNGNGGPPRFPRFFLRMAKNTSGRWGRGRQGPLSLSQENGGRKNSLWPRGTARRPNGGKPGRNGVGGIFGSTPPP